MRESEATQLRLVTERDEAERERWTILRHARDEAERGISLATQLNLRETQVQQLQEELHEVTFILSSSQTFANHERFLSRQSAICPSMESTLTLIDLQVVQTPLPITQSSLPSLPMPHSGIPGARLTLA